VKVLEKGMELLLSRASFPKANEIRNAFTDGSTLIRFMWCRYDCEDWRAKCVEKVRNMYKSQRKNK
jgi:hypothetical protein